jgi:hypothetical protein
MTEVPRSMALSTQQLGLIHTEVKMFPYWYSELQQTRDDAIGQIYSRPPSDTPYVSRSRSTTSSVERVVLNILCNPQVVRLEQIVNACLDLYTTSPNRDKVMLRQLWRGKHTEVLPEDVLLRYHAIKAQSCPDTQELGY